MSDRDNSGSSYELKHPLPPNANCPPALYARVQETIDVRGWDVDHDTGQDGLQGSGLENARDLT